jgi:hypothetical protein
MPTFTPEDQVEALRQGWGVFTTSYIDTPLQLQRSDEMERFDSDEGAWRFVARQAFAGCGVARRALAWIKSESTIEYEAIRLVVDGLIVR